jgi:hypothetical protein
MKRSICWPWSWRMMRRSGIVTPARPRFFDERKVDCAVEEKMRDGVVRALILLEPKKSISRSVGGSPAAKDSGDAPQLSREPN